MTLTVLPFKGFTALLGLALLASPLAAPASAQTPSRPYCFAVQDIVSVFARPALNSATPDRFNPGDIAYATTNPPTVRFDGSRAFVEVAIFGGQRGWLPRLSRVDGPPLVIDLTPDQCVNPPAHAAGGGTPGNPAGGTPYCYLVQVQTPVYTRPQPNAASADRFNSGDIAYATTNPPTPVVSGGRSFIEMAIFGGQRAWVPQRSVDGTTILMDLSADQCTTPPAHAAGGR
jgi:hypothetical protein